MTFDPKVAEAQLALGRIGATDMPRLAWDAMEAGFDGPAIRRLAALEFPTFFEVQDILPAAMQEMRLAKVEKNEAAYRLARLRAQEILDSNLDPMQHLRDFEMLWWEQTTARNLGKSALSTTTYMLPDTQGKWRQRFALGC